MCSCRAIVRIIAVLIVAAYIPSKIQAQVTVKTTIDSAQLFIGQQSLLHLELSGPRNRSYQLPFFPGDTLVNGIEILSKSPVDTAYTGNGLMELKMDFLVTSFDSGLYFIPPMPIVSGTDTFYSNYLGLKVMTLDVDTVKKAYFDIKDVQRPPFVFSDYLFSILLFVLGYGLVLLFIWWYLRRKYRIAQTEINPEETLPPHIVAILELDRLKADKSKKIGHNKEYYTILSDILRKYMGRRFQIFAMEMTSEEILELFRKDKTTQSVYQNLKQILQLSDLVKFAKIEPKENENELSLMNAYLFVNQTKVEEIKSIDEQKEALTDEAGSPDMTDKTHAESKPEDAFTKYMPK